MWGKNSANVTDSGATSVHGTNPQNLVEKILRSKIYNHAYWKEHCFGLTAESLVDKAMELQAVGGTFGGILEPTHFIQLVLKMLQIQPEKEIVIEFIKARALQPLPPPPRRRRPICPGPTTHRPSRSRRTRTTSTCAHWAPSTCA